MAQILGLCHWSLKPREISGFGENRSSMLWTSEKQNSEWNNSLDYKFKQQQQPKERNKQKEKDDEKQKNMEV